MWLMLAWAFLLVFLIGAAIWVVNRQLRARRRETDAAHRILRERLARGEIDEIDYELRRRRLDEP